MKLKRSDYSVMRKDKSLSNFLLFFFGTRDRKIMQVPKGKKYSSLCQFNVHENLKKKIHLCLF